MILTIVRGLPGSGKSTYAKQLNVLHLEADMFCMVDGKYVFSSKNHQDNHAMCQHMCMYAIEAGCDVVVSNTFTQLWEMEPYLEIAEQYGATVRVIRMTGDYRSLHDVPDHVINKMRDRFEDFEGEIVSW